jgi:hypothetical protein
VTPDSPDALERPSIARNGRKENGNKPYCDTSRFLPGNFNGWVVSFIGSDSRTVRKHLYKLLIARIDDLNSTTLNHLKLGHTKGEETPR